MRSLFCCRRLHRSLYVLSLLFCTARDQCLSWPCFGRGLVRNPEDEDREIATRRTIRSVVYKTRTATGEYTTKFTTFEFEAAPDEGTTANSTTIDNTPFVHRSVYPTPSPNMSLQIAGHQACCGVDCLRCDYTKPKFAFVHKVCYWAFMLQLITKKGLRVDESLTLFWVFCRGRNPWVYEWEGRTGQQAPLDREILKGLEVLCGGFRLSDLPDKLLERIHFLSADADFWKAAAVMHAASEMEQRWLDVAQVRLDRVHSWSRGSPIALNCGEPDGLILITLDAFGVKSLEQLEHLPPRSVQNDPDCTYFIEDTSTIGRGFLEIRVSQNLCYPSLYTMRGSLLPVRVRQGEG